MGKFIYSFGLTVDFDDRLLAHLEAVITTKLQRSESFAFSWRDDSEVGDGRTAIWLHPSMPLVFKYLGGRTSDLNARWVTELMRAASRSGGLRIVAEPPAEETAS